MHGVQGEADGALQAAGGSGGGGGGGRWQQEEHWQLDNNNAPCLQDMSDAKRACKRACASRRRFRRSSGVAIRLSSGVFRILNRP